MLFGHGAQVQNAFKAELHSALGAKWQPRCFAGDWDLPLRLGLLIDASNSVRDRFRFEQEAAVQFLSQTQCLQGVACMFLRILTVIDVYLDRSAVCVQAKMMSCLIVRESHRLIPVFFIDSAWFARCEAGRRTST